MSLTEAAFTGGDVVIRASEEADIAAIQVIYAHFVETGLASFEVVPPTVEEMRARRADVIGRGLPHLVAEESGRVLGYAYAGPHRPRPGYRFTIEDSVYVAADAHGRGIGRRLLDTLIDQCEAMGYRQMVAVIGNAANHGSIRLHAAAGFTPIGVMPAVGLKLGRWVDVVLMQRALGEGSGSIPGD